MAPPANLTLYHIAPSRSSIVLWLLEEIGCPYALRVLDAAAGEQRGAAYLAVNPMGKVPALVADGVVLTETGAICCYLADAFPAAGLAPAIGDPERGAFLKWMFFCNGCLEPAILDRMLGRPEAPPHMIGYGDFDRALSQVAAAVTPGPYLLGEAFSAADVVIGSLLGWAGKLGALPEVPALADYVGRLEARPAAVRADARDAALAAAGALPTAADA
jgi:glutathione S-transferase